ncbi:lysostaphin resistance A-like protein [Xanthomonas sp. NCPPB 1638]|uniref:CPBP family intramembrane metalloprotease domain-containing protein n=1 Tax=Xanthomonas cucurbitae TaxID=56453 RepID=A0A2S7DPI6_9XANT|nr:CPBP family intramembrane glutamic endopeptidase [Xanthomonas cucurbitae]PPU75659.1 CPBP family intramembrane metalloprotease domain-containing protein [Xanthomonas cucurbitae]QHG88294.1 CPBP family intramembrane metalloprotease [Xanthomonas cucurbitae]WDM74860.1 CPBP family intramembrane metalloprotease [Xanthomonas cucurbitae]WDM79703.1 CPBP family intramembrane metalloprotease [Xanthomonas cucurbitae]WDM83393.1 CPBP family intramembrane metalloprotease [Xanthomonas cucurbitae]
MPAVTQSPPTSAAPATHAPHAIALGERGILRPGRLRWLRACGWAVVLFFLVAIPTGVVTRSLGSLWPKSNEPVQFAVSTFGALVALGIYALAVRLAEQRTPSEIAVRPMLPQLAIGLLAGAAMFSAVMGIMALFGLYDIQATGPASAWTPLRQALQAGVVEELMMRAAILRLLWRAFGPWTAFAVSSAVFGFSHLGNPNATVLAAVCIALEAGVMLGAFYALTGRIWVSIGAHTAWNFTQGYLFGAAVSGIAPGAAIARSTPNAAMPDMFTGGVFGPEASLPAALVCLAVGLSVVWVAWRTGRFAVR